MRIPSIFDAYRFAVLPLGATLLSVTIAFAASSDDLYDRYFSNVLAGRPCFARTYDAAHLAAHAGQRVRSIEISLAKKNFDGSPNSADRFELEFALMVKSSPEWYGQAAICRTTEAAFECFLKADGGLFRLTPLSDGGLRLDTGEAGIALEGATDTIELSGKTGGDRSFDLVASKTECEAAHAFIEDGNE
jgi:hypothetical protein